jgi:stage II sporulation protein D
MIHWMAATRSYTPPRRSGPSRRRDGRRLDAGAGRHQNPQVPPRLLALLLLAALPVRAEELIRVVVAEGLLGLKLQGDRLTVREPVEEGAAEAAARPLDGAAVEVAARGDGLRVGAAETGPVAVIEAARPLRMGARVLSTVAVVERTGASFRLIEELPLDDYVAGVLSGELPASFPAEAQKAQAVAARTYALVKKIEAEAAGRSFHLGAGVLSQVYAGAAPNPSARAAAEATHGEVLVLGQEPVETFFHSSCGGRTERGLDALGRDLPYLVPVACGHCNQAPGARWTLTRTGAELGKALGLAGPVKSLQVTEQTASGRASRVEAQVGGTRVVYTAADLRQRLGWSTLPSLAFEVKQRGGVFSFSGRGQGHGAGLCQWGAAGMAREGKAYREILRHYYPGTELAKLY